MTEIAFWTPGPLELIVILVVAILIFGRRLPEIARSMGQSIFEFKRGIKEAAKMKDDVADDIKRSCDDADETSKSEQASGA